MLETNKLLPPELDVWWVQHKLADEQRAKRDAEEAKKSADKQERDKYLASVRDRLRSQLTAEELEALGMKTQ